MENFFLIMLVIKLIAVSFFTVIATIFDWALYMGRKKVQSNVMASLGNVTANLGYVMHEIPRISPALMDC